MSGIERDGRLEWRQDDEAEASRDQTALSLSAEREP